MKFIYLYIALLFWTTNYSQFFIGEDFQVAKNGIKTLFKKNNFKFIREEKIIISETSSTCYFLYYKEGFFVNMAYDKYENCTSIQIVIDSKNKEKLYKKLLLIFDFSNWKYIRHNGDGVVLQNFYRYKQNFIYTTEYKNSPEMNYTIVFYEK